MGLVNPLQAEQRALVTLFLESGQVKTHERLLAPRSRVSFDVGEVFDLRGDRSFGLEVFCPLCAASLVMWDAAYTVPAVSAPIVGCR